NAAWAKTDPACASPTLERQIGMFRGAASFSGLTDQPGRICIQYIWRYDMDIKYTIELIGSAFELAGVAVLVIGSVLAFVRSIVSLIRLRDGPAAYRHLRLYLGR